LVLQFRLLWYRVDSIIFIPLKIIFFILILLFIQKPPINPIPLPLTHLLLIHLPIPMPVIILKITHIIMVPTSQLPKPALLVVPVLPLILLSRPHIFKVPLPVSQVVDKFPLVIVAVGPEVFALAVGAIAAVLTHISLAVVEALSAEAVFL
jgi:hypothetical protein